MAAQTVFKRYELKYLLTSEQKQRLVQQMAAFMRMDQYGRTTIRNLYFDTANYRLIRRSIDKPSYKEKLRIRSYSAATADSPVFVELKKKCRGVVYKRRLVLSESAAMEWLCCHGPCPADSQIAREISYFLSFYGDLRPVLFLSYEREAFYACDGSDFRVTFDEHVLCRPDDLSLQSAPRGIELLPPGKVLMEIKCSGGIPLWMTSFLSAEGIYKTSFSKYGTAYQKWIYPEINGDVTNGSFIQRSV